MSGAPPRAGGDEGRAIVVVVGSINADLVVRASRLPAPGETVMGPRVERHGGGKGANAAVAAARLGAAVCLVSATGDDPLGDEALTALRHEGVDVSGVATIAGETTGAALIVVDDAGENQIAVGAGANAALGAEAVRSALGRLLDGAGCVLVNLEVPRDAVAAAVAAGAARGVPVVVNPAPAHSWVLELAAWSPILTPNAGEAAQLTGEPDAGRAAARLAALTGAPVVVTDGAAGAVVVEGPAAPVVAVPAAARVAAVDTTGAGDTFSGALAARIAAGDGVAAAARFAVAAGSCAVREPGARAGMPTVADVLAVLAAVN
ncbi:MAG: ribokinase [Solirubrobacteraceae bacterium]|nr:ribokinase [Solirubrobacteraceae bacterium]